MKYPIAGICLMYLFFGVFSAGCSRLAQSPGDILEQSSGANVPKRVVSFEVIGKGLEPEKSLTKGEAILMAERAAVADGYRQLVEKISGVYVDAFSKIGFGTIDQQTINTKAQSWLRGVEIVKIEQGQHGITEAHMQLRIYFARKNMIWWPSGLEAGM